LIAVVLWLEARVGVERALPGRRLELVLDNWLKLSLRGMMLLVLLTALLVPAMVLGWWLWRDALRGFDPVLIWNSAWPALLAALATVLVALPVAFAATQSGAGRVLERIATIGFGIPGMVMATALVYVGLHIDFLYQSLALLVAAYVLRFLPLAVGSVRNSAARIDGNLLGAARSLGASRLETFRRVSLPLLLPGMSAGAALVFLESMRELPATLLLRPTGMETLTTELWQVFEERKNSHNPDSYVKKLLENPRRLRQKVGEEGVEVALAETNEDLTYEAADLIFHLCVLLFSKGLSWQDLAQELERRRQ